MQSLMTMASGHHESHGPPYAHDSWMGLGAYSQPPSQTISPMHEYQSFDYGPLPMPMEPTYTMPRPPPYVAAHHHPLPPPLVMPQNGIWPSMLTSQNAFQSNVVQQPNPLQTPVSAAPSHGSDITPTSAKSTARRKLTDEERRQMCLEAEQNPTMKQTQIGAKFNVERSTVSKILRHKDKYMKPNIKEETSQSPGKKSKVKLPDVEKTLANWARNQQKKGAPITDDELRKQAVMFSAGRNDQQHVSSASWLDNFKRRYLDPRSDLETPIENSPTSSNGLVSPPMSTADDHASIMAKRENAFDFDNKDAGYDHNLPADMDPSAEPILGPVSPGLNRLDGLAVSLEDDEDHVGFNFSRQRSQTFPHLPEVMNLTHNLAAPKLPGPPTRSVTSITREATRETSIDPRQMMKRHKSVPDIHDAEAVRYSTMQPPPLPRSADLSPVSVPGSPQTQDESMRALYSIKKMLEQRPDVAEPDDYVMIGKLMEKLKLLRSANGTPTMSAGMQAVGAIFDSPRINKKRTILGISN